MYNMIIGYLAASRILRIRLFSPMETDKAIYPMVYAVITHRINDVVAQRIRSRYAMVSHSQTFHRAPVCPWISLGRP